jgi:hypothetical protein
LGNDGNMEPIVVFLSPSCPHCGKTLNSVAEFVKTNGDIRPVVIKFIVTGLKDLYLMKLVGLHSDSPSEFLINLMEYIKRTDNEKSGSSPKQEDEERVANSDNSDEVKDIQIHFLRLRYNAPEIEACKPDPNGREEAKVLENYKNISDEAKELNGGNELDLPLFGFKGKKYESLNEIPD